MMAIQKTENFGFKGMQSVEWGMGQTAKDSTMGHLRKQNAVLSCCLCGQRVSESSRRLTSPRHPFQGDVIAGEKSRSSDAKEHHHSTFDQVEYCKWNPNLPYTAVLGSEDRRQISVVCV